MFLVLSGEGKTDIGEANDAIGPMTKLIDRYISPKLGYSLIDSSGLPSEHRLYLIIPKPALSKKAKDFKALSRKGKKRLSETRYYYNNARALALLAAEESQRLNNTPVIAILFRDGDGTVSSERCEWDDKWQSMIDGFISEGFYNGVPMLPKPKSEAWILCALDRQYQNCAKLEDSSGNNRSPNALKNQLEQHLGEPGSQELLNDKVDRGEIDFQRITDMPSLTRFKERLDEVVDTLLRPGASL
jgi:hypothetical protein